MHSSDGQSIVANDFPQSLREIPDLLMAIEEHDREDLLRDGRTMVLRGQCEIDGIKLLVGFRREGQASLYCGPDPVFQFNGENQLRRVYFHGQRLAARDGVLVELTRDTRGGHVQFQAVPVEEATHDTLLLELNQWLLKVRHAVDNAETDWSVVGASAAGFRANVQAWIQTITERRITVARTPDVG